MPDHDGAAFGMSGMTVALKMSCSAVVGGLTEDCWLPPMLVNGRSQSGIAYSMLDPDDSSAVT